MPSFRVSGILDEGHDADPSFASDRERFLPKSINTSSNQPPRQRSGGMRNISNTISTMRGKFTGRPPTYPRTQQKIQVQQQHMNRGGGSGGGVSSSTRSHTDKVQHHQQQQQLLPQSLQQNPQSSNPQKILPRTMPPLKLIKDEHAFENEYDNSEEDDHYPCCDEDGCHFQPSWHCNEGIKNLCTIAIWAMIVFAIVNRFLIHMGMFYAKGRSVDRVAITFTSNNSNNNVGVNGVAGVDFSVGSSDGGGSDSLEFDGGDSLFVEGGSSLRGRRSLFE